MIKEAKDVEVCGEGSTKMLCEIEVTASALASLQVWAVSPELSGSPGGRGSSTAVSSQRSARSINIVERG